MGVCNTVPLSCPKLRPSSRRSCGGLRRRPNRINSRKRSHRAALVADEKVVFGNDSAVSEYRYRLSALRIPPLALSVASGDRARSAGYEGAHEFGARVLDDGFVCGIGASGRRRDGKLGSQPRAHRGWLPALIRDAARRSRHQHRRRQRPQLCILSTPGPTILRGRPGDRLERRSQRKISRGCLRRAGRAKSAADIESAGQSIHCAARRGLVDTRRAAIRRARR